MDRNRIITCPEDMWDPEHDCTWFHKLSPAGRPCPYDHKCDTCLSKSNTIKWIHKPEFARMKKRGQVYLAGGR